MIVKLKPALAVSEFVSRTPTVNEAVPAAVGVPEITPAVDPRVSPCGRDPVVTLQL